jgi:GTP cyclohydrolase II
VAERSHAVTEPRHAADRALDLVRDRTARPVTGAAQAAAIRQRIRIPLRFADGYSATATVVSFTGLSDAQQHVVLELGRPAAARLPLVRLHSECLTGDVFGSQRCDCGPQLREAVERITKHGGYVLYPDKGAQLARLGITIARQARTALHLTGTNAAYLATKARRGGHDLLSRGAERAAEAHRHGGRLVGPPHPGIPDR